jgi:hypothetical protein
MTAHPPETFNVQLQSQDDAEAQVTALSLPSPNLEGLSAAELDAEGANASDRTPDTRPCYAASASAGRII